MLPVKFICIHKEEKQVQSSMLRLIPLSFSLPMKMDFLQVDRWILFCGHKSFETNVDSGARTNARTVMS
jgi:hypothetical protein